MSTKPKGETESEVSEQHVQFSTSVGYFDNYTEALEAFREEGIVVFRDGALFSKVTDPANVAMCVSKIEGQALNSLELHSSNELTIGLEFSKVLDYLQGVSNTSEVEITWPVMDSGKNMMKLHVIDEDLEFLTTTVDSSAVPPMPQSDPLSHKNRAVVSGTQMKKVANHAGKIIDEDTGSLVFETYGGVLEIRAEDKVEGKFTKKFHQSGPTDAEGLEEHETEIAYSYIQDVKKMLGRGDETTIHIKESHPVRFDINLDDSGNAQVLYIIAPRVET